MIDGDPQPPARQVRALFDETTLVHNLITDGNLDAAGHELPVERIYPLTGSIGTAIGA